MKITTLLKTVALAFFLFQFMAGHGQLVAVIKDSITNEPVPYVNIWIEDQMTGTTSDENGRFTLEANNNGTPTIVFSAIGYKQKRIRFSDIGAVVLLNQSTIQLDEVVVRPQKNGGKTISVGEFKKSAISFYFGCGTAPWMVARFFPYQQSYSDTPFLKTLSIVTKSDVANAKFNLRLYTVKDDGQIDAPVYTENIIVSAKKGDTVTKVDLSERHIAFPDKGLLIAVEFLIIKENKFIRTLTSKETNKKTEWITFEPSIGTIPDETGETALQYSKGNWSKVRKNSNNIGLSAYRNKYNLLAMKLELSD